MPHSDPDRFASVYDVIYTDPAFLGVQEAFLARSLSYSGRVLDAGCGTGQHLILLHRLGLEPVGLDLSRAMLTMSRARCAGTGLVPSLVLGDIRALPFAAEFNSLICLESPLAYLIDDADLRAALSSFHTVLHPGGRLVIDIFDYPGTAPKARIRPATRCFPAAWGSVDVTESHRHDRKTGIWYMRQQFSVARDGEIEAFEMAHRFRTRTAPEYAEALENAGFAIDALLPAYPDTPPTLAHERRILIAAHRF
jgi:SAM-dependent methyltransferase